MTESPTPSPTFTPLTEEQIEGFRIVLRNWTSRDGGDVQDRWDTLCDMALASLSLPSPCGHPSQYAYSEDGGAHIICLLCARERTASERSDIGKDAARYRWLSDTLHGAVGGGVEINDAKLIYEEPAAGEAVRIYWYPNTPVGFNQVTADTLDAAIDEAMK